MNCPICNTETELYEPLHDAADFQGRHVQSESKKRYCKNVSCLHYDDPIIDAQDWAE